MPLVGASTAWKLLRGLVCLYKPCGVPMQRLVDDARDSLINELNMVDRHPDNDDENFIRVQQDGGLIDYSSHRSVLGDKFENPDVEFFLVDDLDADTSGMAMVTINDEKLSKSVAGHRFPHYYRVGMELGLAKDNSFHDGKTVERATYNHLKGRPHYLTKVLASICSSHQRDAFRQANVCLRSQQAYELASRGIVRPRPEHDVSALILNVRVLKFRPPKIDLAVVCVNESHSYLAELVAEIGIRMRTRAFCTSIHLERVGHVTAIDHALLPKHVTVQNVVENRRTIAKLIPDEMPAMIYQ